MKKYDYILVGSGLVFWCFCLVWQSQHGKSCLVVEKRDHIGGNVYCEETEASTYINTAPTFSIQVIKKYGSL